MRMDAPNSRARSEEKEIERPNCFHLKVRRKRRTKLKSEHVCRFYMCACHPKGKGKAAKRIVNISLLFLFLPGWCGLHKLARALSKQLKALKCAKFCKTAASPIIDNGLSAFSGRCVRPRLPHLEASFGGALGCLRVDVLARHLLSSMWQCKARERAEHRRTTTGPQAAGTGAGGDWLARRKPKRRRLQ